MTYRDLGFVIF